MKPQKEKPAAPGQERTGIVEEGFSADCIKLRQGTKEYGVLAALVAGRSIDRFQAARDLHDSCLNTTIAALGAKGLRIDRVWKTIPCVRGTKTTRVLQYSLPADELPRARRMLALDGGMEAQHG